MKFEKKQCLCNDIYREELDQNNYLIFLKIFKNKYNPNNMQATDN